MKKDQVSYEDKRKVVAILIKTPTDNAACNLRYVRVIMTSLLDYNTRGQKARNSNASSQSKGELQQIKIVIVVYDVL